MRPSPLSPFAIVEKISGNQLLCLKACIIIFLYFYGFYGAQMHEHTTTQMLPALMHQIILAQRLNSFSVQKLCTTIGMHTCTFCVQVFCLCVCSDKSEWIRNNTENIFRSPQIINFASCKVSGLIFLARTPCTLTTFLKEICYRESWPVY